jgi:hypothetical protein
VNDGPRKRAIVFLGVAPHAGAPLGQGDALDSERRAITQSSIAYNTPKKNGALFSQVFGGCLQLRCVVGKLE